MFLILNHQQGGFIFMFALTGILSQSATLTPPLYKNLILKDSPRFYYRFDDPVGSEQITDYSGNNFHATAGSSLQFRQSNIVTNRSLGCTYLPSTSNSALSEEIVTVPWQLTTGTTFSIEAWIKIDSTKSGDINRSLFGMDTETPDRTYFEFTLTNLNGSTPELNFLIESGSSLTRMFTVVPWVNTNVYHVVLVISSTSSSNRRLHINNVQYNNTTTFGSSRTTAVNRLLTSASQGDRPTWYIGQGYNNARNYGGLISDFAVYTYALTQQQINEHYLKGTGQI